MGELVQLDGARRRPRTCFVTGEEHHLAGALQSAVVLGCRVQVSQKGKAALEQFAMTGNLRDLPEGPARRMLADAKATHMARQLTMALQWFLQHPGASLTACPGGQGVHAMIPGANGPRVQHVGQTTLEVLEKGVHAGANGPRVQHVGQTALEVLEKCYQALEGPKREDDAK